MGANYTDGKLVVDLVGNGTYVEPAYTFVTETLASLRRGQKSTNDRSTIPRAIVILGFQYQLAF